MTTEEIAQDIRARHASHPRLGAFMRVVGNCGVQTRNFTRPLHSPTVAGDADVHTRTQAAFDDALDLAERAALSALETAGLTAADVDAVVTSHATGYSVPNLDAHLIHRLGLRPTVRRIALTTMACAGGVHALVKAADLVLLRPHEKVLVVAAEVLSTAYNHRADTIEAMIYKALFADAAGAAVVSSTPLASGLAVADSLEYTLPGSLDRYRGRLDAHGMHFDSTKQAPRAPAESMPALTEWLDGRPVDFAVIHPGSLKMISDTADTLGLGPAHTVHSTETLAEDGNIGGVSALRVLERTHLSPPPPGAPGAMVAYGPGFTTAALYGHWHA
ncbi:PhlD [Streptomyces sp. SID5785]|uniref:PhlD n=1 Tax=Streptomyces sp. SID5785 TaxID=2690309 RepID=UPI0031BB3D6C